MFAGALALLLAPRAAEAHLVTTGLGPFYDGISHLLLTPQDLLPLLAVCLLAGLRGPRSARTVLFALPTAWLAGGLLGLSHGSELSLPVVTASSVLLLGGLVAADRQLPRHVVTGIAILFALVHGYLNGTAMSEAGLGAVGLLGIASLVFALAALLGAAAVLLRAGWTRIAVRVAGSWIVAIGLFMLGWTLR